MNPNALLESASLRHELCQEENTTILQEIGQLITLPSTGYATTEQVAEFYQVSENTVRQTVFYHKEEFVEHGYKILNKNELSELGNLTHSTTCKERSYRIAIFPRLAILLLGCLLRDSPIARQVRWYLIHLEQTGISTLLQKIARIEQKVASIERGQEEIKKRMSETEECIAGLKKWAWGVENGSEEMQKQIARSTGDIANMKKWLLSLETYLIEWENRFTAEEPLLGEGRGQTISARQVQLLKQKIHEQPDWPKVLKEFKKHFDLRRYSALPKSEWEAALAWLARLTTPD